MRKSALQASLRADFDCRVSLQVERSMPFCIGKQRPIISFGIMEPFQLNCPALHKKSICQSVFQRQVESQRGLWVSQKWLGRQTGRLSAPQEIEGSCFLLRMDPGGVKQWKMRLHWGSDQDASHSNFLKLAFAGQDSTVCSPKRSVLQCYPYNFLNEWPWISLSFHVGKMEITGPTSQGCWQDHLVHITFHPGSGWLGWPINWKQSGERGGQVALGGNKELFYGHQKLLVSLRNLGFPRPLPWGKKIKEISKCSLAFPHSIGELLVTKYCLGNLRRRPHRQASSQPPADI